MHHAAPDVQGCERTSRFLVEEGHFAVSKRRVKPRAYQPSREDNQTSVICADNLGEALIWETGDVYVAPIRGKPILARGDLATRHIRAAGLHVVRDDEFPGHANIAGWPTAKDEWKSKAQQLAASARLVLKPDVTQT